jgi:hypothetical protein
MRHSQHLLRLPVLGVLLATLCAPAFADSGTGSGLRISPRGDAIVGSDGDSPASLRFSLSHYDTSALDTPAATTPLMLNLPQNTTSTNRSNAFWADWYPFDSGLRTSAGLVWSDGNHHSGNAFDAGSDNVMHSRAFLGLGWTSAASSSSVGWRLNADVGASLTSIRDCAAGQCMGPGAGLKPYSGGDGIRWNPFISIGASFQY